MAESKTVIKTVKTTKGKSDTVKVVKKETVKFQ